MQRFGSKNIAIHTTLCTPDGDGFTLVLSRSPEINADHVAALDFSDPILRQLVSFSLLTFVNGAATLTALAGGYSFLFTSANETYTIYGKFRTTIPNDAPELKIPYTVSAMYTPGWAAGAGKIIVNPTPQDCPPNITYTPLSLCDGTYVIAHIVAYADPAHGVSSIVFEYEMETANHAKEIRTTSLAFTTTQEVCTQSYTSSHTYSPDLWHAALDRSNVGGDPPKYTTIRKYTVVSTSGTYEFAAQVSGNTQTHKITVQAVASACNALPNTFSGPPGMPDAVTPDNIGRIGSTCSVAYNTCTGAYTPAYSQQIETRKARGLSGGRSCITCPYCPDYTADTTTGAIETPHSGNKTITFAGMFPVDLYISETDTMTYSEAYGTASVTYTFVKPVGSSTLTLTITNTSATTTPVSYPPTPAVSGAVYDTKSGTVTKDYKFECSNVVLRLVGSFVNVGIADFADCVPESTIVPYQAVSQSGFSSTGIMLYITGSF